MLDSSSLQDHSLKGKVPAISALLETDTLQACIKKYGHTQTRDKARTVVAQLRKAMLEQQVVDSASDVESVAKRIEQSLQADNSYSLKPVFNLTGTVIHTNLGRAPLPLDAIKQMQAVAGACNLEFDLQDAKRGDRDDHVEQRLCELCGAEAATVVNNNAAALVLTLNTLAKDKWVSVSRGELIEIGGSFRIPEIIAAAGCHIHEIGTTNRTHLKDYAASINLGAALLLKVHTSNYTVEGFTKSVSEKELVALGQQNDVPVVSDLGSGELIDLQQYSLPKEPVVKELLQAGVDVVTFSGDKLLGGPQAGIIVGKKKYVDLIKRNPLKRALRVDKLIMAALEAVLRLYGNPESLASNLPTLRLLTRSLADIEKVAQTIQPLMSNLLKDCADISIVDCASQIGSGALPADRLSSKAIAVKPIPKAGKTDERLNTIFARFRQLPIPVVGRINDGVLYFDLRCLEDVDGFTSQLTAEHFENL